MFRQASRRACWPAISSLPCPPMHKLLSRLRAPRTPELRGVPLGDELELPWNLTIEACRQRLVAVERAVGEVGGYPSLKALWGERHMRGYTEFAVGEAIGPAWLPQTRGSVLFDARGEPLRMHRRLRGVVMEFQDMNPRHNWKGSLQVLGRPTERKRDGSWTWEWPGMTATLCPPPEGTLETEQVRFEPRCCTIDFEIRNLSSYDLHKGLYAQLAFDGGSWVTASAPPAGGIPASLYWTVPQEQPLRLTVSCAAGEFTVDVPPGTHKAVLSNQGDGVRIAV